MNRIRNNGIIVVLVILVFTSLVSPIILGCFYAVPSADDFSNSFRWMENDENKFIFLFKYMIDTYKTWQGTYLGSFICAFPIFYVLGFKGLRAFLIIVVIVFFVGCWCCISSFLERVNTNDKKRGICLILIVSLLGLLGRNTLDEIFYWYTGVAVYTIPVCIMFFCIYIYLKYRQNKKTKHLILGIILAFLVSGGALVIAALNCSIILLGVIYGFLVNKKIDKSFLIWLSSFIGAVINTVAPGNFVRRTYIDDGSIHLFTSVLYTFKRTTQVISNEYRSGWLLLVMIAVFIWGYKNLENSEYKFRYPVLVSIYGFLAFFITDFPFVLGCGTTSLPDRVRFIEYLALSIYAIIISLFWAGWAVKKNIFRLDRTVVALLVLVWMSQASYYLDFDHLLELTPYKMAYHILNQDFGKITQKEESVLEQIRNSEECEVEVRLIPNEPDEWSNIRRTGITENKDHWQNSALARYYGKESVVLVYEDE